MVAVVVVAVSAIVLAARSTPDATMGADSVPEAVATVGFYAVVPLVLFVALVRTVGATFVLGDVLTLLFGAMWWSAATDWDSTAAIGPSLAAIVALAVVLGGVAVERRWPA